MAIYTDPHLVISSDLPIIFWRNVVTVANISTPQGTDDPDFPISNAANSSLGNKWKEDFTDSPTTGPAFIDIDLEGLGPTNYIAIAGHNLGTIGSIIRLEGFGGAGGSPSHQDSPNLADWVNEFEPIDNSPIILMWEETEDTTQMRLVIDHIHETPAEIAVIYAGRSTVMDEGIQADHTPLPLAKKRKAVIGQSENGSFLGRIILGEWVQSRAVFANLESPWVRDELIPFLEYAAEFPFFYAWSPQTYPEEVAYAWMDGDPAPSFDIDGYAAVEFDMKGVVE